MNDEEKEALEFVEIEDDDDLEEETKKGNGMSHLVYLGVGAALGAGLLWVGGKAKNVVVEKIDAHKAKKAAKAQAKINAIEPDFDDDEVEG